MTSKQGKRKLSLEGKLHKPSSKEFEGIFYGEHKRHCGYLRNIYTNKKHNYLNGICSLNKKICPYHNYNTSVFNCEIENKYFGFRR